MSLEQERSIFAEPLSKYLEVPKSTGHLMRIAKGIMRINPLIQEQTSTAAYLNIPWISFAWNDLKYLVRFDKKEIQTVQEDAYVMDLGSLSVYQKPGPTKTIEILSITKYLPDGKAEEIQIVNEGYDSEQKFDSDKGEFVEKENGGEIFRGISYVVGKDKVGEEFKDEKTKETASEAEYSIPLTGKDALLEAKRILKELVAW